MTEKQPSSNQWRDAVRQGARVGAITGSIITGVQLVRDPLRLDTAAGLREFAIRFVVNLISFIVAMVLVYRVAGGSSRQR